MLISICEVAEAINVIHLHNFMQLLVSRIFENVTGRMSILKVT